MFIGEYQHTMDKKGRINVPSKFREILGASFIMAEGVDGCIFVFQMEDWKVFKDRIEKQSVSNDNEEARRLRRFKRRFFASAVECEPDNLGRVLIPQNLREHAGLVKEVVTIGVCDKVEIWDKQRWESYNETDGFNDEDLAAKMSEFGI